MASLYVDHMSQPSRACMLFCRLNNLDVQEVLVPIGKGATRDPKYKNPLKKIPYLEEPDGFGLPESSAILRYLCTTRSQAIADNWYPIEPRARATVDAIMAWHGSTLRIGSMIVVWNLAIAANLGLQGNKDLVEIYGRPTLQEALRVLNDVWLRNNTKFLVGDQISIADIQLSCEIEQLCLLDPVPGVPKMAELLSPYHRVTAWLDNVRATCQPQYDDVHKMLRLVRDRQLSKNTSSKM